VKPQYFRLKFSFAVLLVPSLFALHGVAASQSLDDVVRTSMAIYPTVVAAQARLESAQSDITRAQGRHYPQLSWRGTTSNYSGVQTNGGVEAQGLSPDNNWIQSPTVTVNIWSGGEIQADVDKSTYTSQLRFNQKRQTRNDVALFALESYLNWARAIELIHYAQLNVEAHRKIYSDVKKITQVDQGRMIDLDQAQVRLQNAEIALKRRETDGVVSAQRLERMMQGPVPSIPSGVSHIPGDVPATKQAALSFVNDTHPAIAAQHAQIEVARAKLSAARSQYSPKVDFSYGKQISQGSGQGDYIAQLSINIPIFQGGATYGAVGSASSELLAAQQGLSETRLLLNEKILSVWPEIKASRIKKELALRQTQTGQVIVTGFEQQFLVGRQSLLNLLNVQSELFNYQTKLTIATFDELLTKARMINAIGKLAVAYQLEEKPIEHAYTGRLGSHNN
jgi:adhesin transport system outer membrane protein